MLSKVRAELDEALKKAQTSSAAEMTAKEELKEQALLAKEVIVMSVFFQNDRKFFSRQRYSLQAGLHVQTSVEGYTLWHVHVCMMNIRMSGASSVIEWEHERF